MISSRTNPRIHSSLASNSGSVEKSQDIGPSYLGVVVIQTLRELDHEIPKGIQLADDLTGAARRP